MWENVLTGSLSNKQMDWIDDFGYGYFFVIVDAMRYKYLYSQLKNGCTENTEAKLCSC